MESLPFLLLLVAALAFAAPASAQPLSQWLEYKHVNVASPFLHAGESTQVTVEGIKRVCPNSAQVLPAGTLRLRIDPPDAGLQVDGAMEAPLPQQVCALQMTQELTMAAFKVTAPPAPRQGRQDVTVRFSLQADASDAVTDSFTLHGSFPVAVLGADDPGVQGTASVPVQVANSSSPTAHPSPTPGILLAFPLLGAAALRRRA